MSVLEFLSREGSPTPVQKIILAAPPAKPDKATIISIPDIKTPGGQEPQGQHIRRHRVPASKDDLGQPPADQPLQLTAAGQIVTSDGAPLKRTQTQLLTTSPAGGSLWRQVTSQDWAFVTPPASLCPQSQAENLR